MKRIQQLLLSLGAAAALLSVAAPAGWAQASAATNDETPPAVFETSDNVAVGHDIELRADEHARQVVAVFGSVNVQGKVRGDVVAVFGNVHIDGEVGGKVVSVFGGVTLGSNAVVRQDLVTVGGGLNRAPGAQVHGRIQQSTIDLLDYKGASGLKSWFAQCVVKMRPLAPQVAWVWPVAGVFFLLYLLIAAAFPTAVAACVTAVNEQPITTLAVGLLGQLAVGIFCILLLCTVIGIPLIVAVVVAFLV
ncbi:MAG TPA: polymer-forming cytoskeletal protein, partial [Verrucomicrobiae bacterium]|nr:polymer-forming cytoskeletal protein [Verrucomicrobiae bacterium]